MVDTGSMTKNPSWLRTAHRVHALVTVAIVITLITLNLRGAISGRTATLVFASIEIPLFILFAGVTFIRFRSLIRPTDDRSITFLERLEAEEPLLRPVVAETRAYQSLALAIFRKRRVPTGTTPFGYSKGTMTFPAVMIGFSVVELVVVHLLVPWQWLQILLLVLTVWGVLFIAGYLASRFVNPHFLANGKLHLRWEHKTVLVTQISNIQSVVRHANHAHSYPTIEGERLVLTQFKSTNVKLTFTDPVPAAPPISKKLIPERYEASEVHLYVDDPDGFIHALHSSRMETTQ